MSMKDDMFVVMSLKARTIEAYEGYTERRDECLVHRVDMIYLRPAVVPAFIVSGGSRNGRTTRKKLIAENG